MTTTPRSRIISTSDLGWEEFRPGISFKILWEDPATKRRAQMTRFGPGARLPRHRHAGDELIFVIEGELTDEAGTVTAGNVVYRPNGRDRLRRGLGPHRTRLRERDVVF